jgi:hypothetical protein
MTASRHRRLARTGGHPRRRAPVNKCAPCYRSPAPRVNARFCRSETAHQAPELDVLRVQALSAQRDPYAPESALGRVPR